MKNLSSGARLHHLQVIFLFCCFTIIGSTITIAQVRGIYDTAAFTRQYSANARLMMNSNGILGAASFPADSMKKYFDPRIITGNPYVEQPGFEYPIHSGQEHLSSGGLWVGAIIRSGERRRYAVSTVGEFLGRHIASDTFFTANAYEPNSRARRFIDDDGDGLIDEDPIDGVDNDSDWVRVADDINHDGIPDHGEPHVDEDGGAISEHDLYVAYRDSFLLPRISGHTRLGLRILQKSYAWKNLIKEPIFPIEYVIVNRGQLYLDSVYLGFEAQVFIGPYYPKIRLEGRAFGNAPRTYEVKFLPSVRTAAIGATSAYFPSLTPLGITLLGASKPLSDLQLTFRYLAPLRITNDSLRYVVMSSGIVDRDTSIGPTRNSQGFLLSVGPFRNFNPGDTVKLSIALVMGENLTIGYNNIHDNALVVLDLYNRDFKPPNVPPSPPLRLTQLKNGVMLDWKWQPNDPTPNPEETWDDDNNFLQGLPETHWRKRNPPAGKTRGGRIFEGYRVWRSDIPVFDEKSFSLLYQYDVDDDLGFEQQTGIEYRYIDTPIVRGKKYFYAVTSYSIPDYYIALDTIPGGGFIPDTVLTPVLESQIYENAIFYQLPFTPSYKVGEVKVVPNPYRTDQDYTFEGGGWEGLGRLWNEYDRQIWFTHLPPKCTIRIFTMVGEVVATLYHDDAARIAQGLPEGQQEWSLLSESNRAIASGVYVFLVESEYGTQTGKFVVIR